MKKVEHGVNMLSILFYLLENYMLFEQHATNTLALDDTNANHAVAAELSKLLDLLNQWLTAHQQVSQQTVYYQTTRVLSPVEKAALTHDAQQLLYQLIQLKLLSTTTLETVLTVCLHYSGKRLINTARLAYIALFVILNPQQPLNTLCSLFTDIQTGLSNLSRVTH